MKPVRLLPEVRAELNNAIEVYEQQREGRGNRFRNAVERAVERIRHSPRLFAKYKRTRYRQCIVSRFPYAVYFHERDDEIVIVAVAHGKHRPDYWLRRLRNREESDS